MNTFLKIIIMLVALIALVGVLIVVLRPWYMRVGATEVDLARSLPGDELVPAPLGIRNTAIDIQAPPEKIYPWILQIGAERGGWYSFAALENMAGCKITNAESINPEWQNRQVGDLVKMCPGTSGPPAYTILRLVPNQAFIIGHPEKDGSITDSWQFVLIPVDANTTRLAMRTRTMLAGGVWTIFDPIAVVMEQGMIRGIKERAERP